MVAAANPLAVEAGLAVLKRGGSAVDAAVAVQAVLGLVEPQSSGLGGGAFMLFRDGRTGAMTTYDGREVAPKSATPAWFLGADGKPLPFFTAVLSGRATGVPGAVAMLSLAQKEHGRLAWPSLFTDAARLASDGFIVSPRLAGMLDAPLPQTKAPDTVRYFTKPEGGRYAVGDRLRNPAYAATLRRIAAEGPAGLLTGPVAADIVARVHEGDHASTLTTADLAAYRSVKREALCRPYRAYVICAASPPAGGIGLVELMGLLERTDIASAAGPSPQGWVAFAQASRLMYADRDYYVGDPAFVSVPVAGLLAPDYLTRRAALIGKLGPGAPKPGDPAGATMPGRDRTVEPGGTTHFVIVDRWGDVVSMTTTVESIFGSGRMVDGFFLNNQLTDFSFSPVNADGTPAANAVVGGKRPRSSMSPALVLDRRGKFLMAVGSPGGPNIIAYVAKALVGTLDWRLSVQDALALPNVIGRGPNVSVEGDKLDPASVAALRATGALVTTGSGEGSGLHAIRLRPDGTLEGGADPRREGVARGW